MVCALLLLGLSGCSEALQRDLEERAANEVVVVLSAEGVAARKVQGTGDGWSVTVPRSQVGRGLAVLTDYGLPRRESDYAALLGESGGLVPSEADERARRAALVEASLAGTLLALDGVFDARVHAVLPTPTRALGSTAAVASPRMSIVLVTRSESGGPPDDAVRAIAMGAVEGLSSGDISIIRSVVRLPELSEVEVVQFGPYAVTSGSLAGLRAVIGGLAGALMVLSAVLIGLVVRRRGGR